MRVALRHRGTGKIKYVDTGWSWSVFLSAGFFGLPLFLRGLSLWGTVMVITWCLRFVSAAHRRIDRGCRDDAALPVLS